ncbi:MAG: hypothetical protein GX800_00515, partial [Clostridiaceae bacterium]|nr:hypothetical protein [Clostridiaceae bacterium]
MSDIPIQGMDFRQLRNEVQLLRDELAITKRKYEDLLYNLDDDNFADYIKKEKENMKTEIKVSAEGIGILVSEVYPNGVENESSIEVNAREISYKVSAIDVDNKLVNYSTITQTATAITSAVNNERQYTTNLLDTDYYTKVQTNSQITQSANSIYSSVSATYETKDGASSNFSNLDSRIIQTETAITLKVSADYSEPILTSSSPPYSDKTRLYYNTSNDYYYFWNGSAWAVATSNNIYSAFEQTATGFNLSGNVRIDGNTVITENLKLSGTVTWDMNNSPVKSMYSQYNLGNPNTHPTYWHSLFQTNDKYMVVSFDGGSNWGNITKIVGTDGVNGVDGVDGVDGKDGTDATVSPQNVFNALTAGGTQQ